MKKQFKLSNLVLALGLIQSTQASATDIQCDEKCTAQEFVGQVSENNAIQNMYVTENVERNLMMKHFVFHGLSDAKLEELSFENKTKGGMSFRKDTAIRFHSGKHFISEQTLKEMNKVLELLKNKKELTLHFIGHADSQRLSANARKAYATNQELSEFRANIAAKYFKEKLNLIDDVITTEGKSDRIPLASNTTLVGMAKNRRVEVIATYVESEKIFLPNQVCAGKVKPVDGMRITVDGMPISAGKSINNADEQRCADVALEKLDIQLQYDNLKNEPLLNINHALINSDNKIKLIVQGYSNYLYYIEKAELLIFKGSSQKAIQTIPLDESLSGAWEIPSTTINNIKIANTVNGLSYRLRVYDSTGKFDETLDQTISLADYLDKENKNHQEVLTNTLLAGYGASKLAKQNIEIRGGTLTLNGKNIPIDHQVYFLGRMLNISQKRSFVVQQLLPENIHRAEVVVLNKDGNGQIIYRDLAFKKNDWFYVGLADVTLGKNSTNGPIKLVTGDNQHFDDDLFVDARLAFYAKGKVGEGYTLTTSVDTREQPLNKLFSNFSAKDPNSLFRRLEDENHFSVYGDDSTLQEDAPTKGKFYLKVENNQSHALWGNFSTKFDQTDLTRIERGLYGAQIDWNSEDITSFGEKQTQINVFAAEADTSATYEQHRGTGGSLYYLQHQDITQGSERLAIEIRDKDSDIVLSRTTLIAGSDYNVDSLQGRILLNKPLASTSNDGLLIRDAGISGHPVYLVVNYEYVPGFESLDDLAIGGRASYWLNDSVKLGITGSKQDIGVEDQKLLGFDLLYRYSEDSYVKAESASSDGFSLGAQSSTNGGYHFNAIETLNTSSKANAGFSFYDLGFNTQGQGQFYWQNKEAGYSGLGQLTRYDTEQVGGNLKWALSEDSDIRLKLDKRQEDGGIDKQSAELNLIHSLDENWLVSVGIRHDKTIPSTISQTQNTGLRTDLAIQLDYENDPDWRAQLRVDLAISDTNNANSFNSDFTEALLGFAYRPINNDKLNALFTYNFLEDLAPSEQFTGNGIQNDYQQRSHVLAIDANYDLTARWTIGGKIAYREGDIREGRDEGVWFNSSTNLYIVRADWHIVKSWNFLVEARLLEVSKAEDNRSGALIAVHRHIGDHIKLGIGYNFSDFSDDLTDLNYDAKGWFINLVGKF